VLVSRVVLLGAGGFTGRLIAAELARRGHGFVAAGRDARRVRGHLHELPGLDDVRAFDATDADSLDRALADATLVVSSVGPFERFGRPVLDAAIRAGCHYVDVTGEQPFVRWAYEERDAAARAAGATMVPGAGFEFVPGDLLAHIASEAVQGAEEVHVTYLVRGRGLAPATSAGTRRSAATLLGRTGVARADGVLAEELPGEVRRLAWFPKPVGPAHAAGIPGAEPITVPRHVPGVRTVRTYLALPGWQAELLQSVANAARWDPLRRRLTQLLDVGSDGPGPARRAATRWACVAESAGDPGVARAWAYGTDIYGTTAVIAVAVSEAILAGGTPTGVVPPALLGEPAGILDTLAARSDLLWSVDRPDADRAGRDPRGTRPDG
jgi:short subunit dehydrogenase-like uncharacterized protein